MIGAGSLAPRLLYGAWRLAARRDHDRFVEALDDPARAQARLLRRILRANAASAAGRRYGFAGIRTPDEFRERVPLSRYEDLADEIASLRAGRRGVLTADQPTRLVPSGGTSGPHKLVPFTDALGRDFSRAVGAWITDLAGAHEGLTGGPAYWSVSPAMDPPALESAVPIGFDGDTAYLGRALAPLIRRTLVAPDELARARPLSAFRYATLRLLLAARELRLISVWHPSFLSILLDAREGFWDRLIDDVRRGSLTPPSPLPDDVHRAVLRRCRRDPRRADELRRLGSMADVGAVWPELRLVSAWGDAAAAAPFASLARRCAPAAVQPKGLLATEACVTIPFRGRHPCAITSTFIELLDERGNAHGIADVADGQHYEVVVTTAGGLYRYRLGDRVRVDGHVDGTPSLRLVGRADQVVDIVGEKLSGAFVAEALSRTCASDFALLAVEHGQYALYVDTEPDDADTLLRRVTAELRRNPSFAYAQDLGQLDGLRIVVCGRAAPSRYIEHRHARGQSLGDVKPAALAGEGRWTSILTR